MPLSTPTPSRCGTCHGGPCLLDTPPALLCGEGGASDHHAPATMAVEYVVDETGRRDYDNGDTDRRVLYTCSHPACIGSAENHAHDAGMHVETRPLQVADYEDATGLLAEVAA